MKSPAPCIALAAIFYVNGALAGTVSDIETGLSLFGRGCTACHDNTSYMVKADGPPLFGIVGRRVGSVTQFTYSPALRDAYRNGDVWSTGRLDKFLADPNHMYPGTTMPWSFSEQKDRKAVVAYLKSLSAPKRKR